MNMELFLPIMAPLAGTALGSALVYVLRHGFSNSLERILAGFAAGVMTAASVWSLIIPAIEACESWGNFAFVPAVIGFWVGILFLLGLDELTPHLHIGAEKAEGPAKKLRKNTLMILAVVLHNIPEGLAVGVVFAGVIAQNGLVSLSGGVALAIGIAIQNIPEGAIISMPLHAQGLSKNKSFWYGVLSGAVEPLASVLTLLFASVVTPILPYCLAFAAGAMMYVVVEELIPMMTAGEHSNAGTIFFAIGFTLMMVLDVALG